MNIFLATLTVLAAAGVVAPCALPFWWSEQYHFPPYYPQSGKPKSTYRYRETYAQSNPNNFIHIKEYTQHTWWEHDTSGNNDPQVHIVQTSGNGIPPSIKGRGSSSDGFQLSDNSIQPPSGNEFQRPNFNDGAFIKGGGADSGVFPSLDDAKNTVSRMDTTPKTTTRTTEKTTAGTTEKTTAADTREETTARSTRRTTARTTRSTTTSTAASVSESTTASTAASSEASSTTRRGSARRTTASASESTAASTASSTEASTASSAEASTTTRRSATRRTTARRTTTTSSSVELANEREKNDEENSIIISSNVDLEESAGQIRDKTVANSSTDENERSGNLLSNLFSSNAVVNETEPCKVAESDIHSLRSMIEKMFSLPRDHMMHPDSKEKAREDILKKFREFGLQVWTQNFTTPPVSMHNDTEETRDGVNLIGVIPGKQRGQLSDGIVLVGAHYDTVSNTNGVDDNGSGLAVMLEVARALTQARCRFNNTLMFVAFDHEEDGAMGSNFFVDHYLIPEELKRARAHFQGAFILDGILNFSDDPDTQELPLDYTESLPGLQYFVNNTGNRGNFLAMISRNDLDSHLTKHLMEAWQELGKHQYKLFNLAVNMGHKVPSQNVIERHLNFLRSDHATFWYHNSSSHFPESLNAVLLTDTGPYRGQMKQCYHSKCDDLTVMSPEKLQFAKKTADALTATLVELTKATNSGSKIGPSYLTCLLLFVVFYNLKRSGKL